MGPEENASDPVHLSIAASVRDWACKIVNICIHCRLQIQLYFSTAILGYAFVIIAIHNVHEPRYNVPAAASSCTAACGAACSSSFFPESTNLTAREYWIPKELFGRTAPALWMQVCCLLWTRTRTAPESSDVRPNPHCSRYTSSVTLLTSGG
jgi:hypothetical protein